MRKITTVQNFLFSSNPEGKLAFFVLAFFALFLFVPQNKSYSATCGPIECSSQGKYNCQSDTMCCTGNGCPSWDCRDSGTGCFWTGDETGAGTCGRQCAANFVCYNSSTGDTCASSNCSPTPKNGCDWYCLAGWVAPGTGVGSTYTCTWGLDPSSTCAYCSGSGVGVTSPPPGTTYGKITGRMFSDYNKDNQPNGSGEAWSNSTSACAVYKSDTLNNTIGGSNIIPGTGWSCDGSGAYSVSNDIVTGLKDVTLVGALPGSVNCGNVKWSYSTSPGSNGKSGSGCVAAGLNITTGANYLWWWAVPNTPPTVTLSPTTINYSAGGEVHAIKVAITDPDPNGTLKIPSTLTAGLGATRQTVAIEFLAYGNQYNGQWPIVRIYGWRKDTGVRVLIADAWRAGATDILIDSATPKWFYVGVPWTDANAYSHFDLEFINDIWDPVTRTGTDVFVDNVSFFQDDPVWDWYPYVVQAEDANWVQYDRGDPDDGYDVLPSTSWPIVANSGNNYIMMAWGGALRFPVLWTSPSTSTSGNMTFNVSDEYGTVVSKSVSINPRTRNISGKLWTIPSGTVVDNAYCTNNRASAPGLSPARVTANYTGLFDDTDGGGLYNIPNVFGYVDNLSLSNVTSPPVYRIACVNDEAWTETGLTTSHIANTSPTNQTINIGLRIIDAKKWIAGMGSDIYAKNIAMYLPSISCPNSQTYLCPSFPPSGYYALNYGAASSTVFTGTAANSIGPVIQRLSESGITATKIGDKFASKNKEYFKTVSQMIKDITADTTNGYPRVTGAYLYYSNNTTLQPNSITIMSPAHSIYTYSAYNVPSGVAFLIVPKYGNEPLYINNIIARGAGRLVVLADRDVIIGNSIPASNTGSCDPKTCVSTSSPTAPIPSIQASIISTGKITIENYPITATSSPGMIVVEGTLAGAGDLTVKRDLGSSSNEFRPALFIRYNPLYMTALNKIAVENSIPALNDLFTFDFSQEEKK